MQATLEAVGPDHVQGAFDASFVLLAMKTHRPTLTVKIPKREGKGAKEVVLQVDGAAVNEDEKKATETSLDLLPKTARNRLNAAYHRVSAYLRDDDVTTKHPTLDALRILPATNQEAFFGGWPAVYDRFKDDMEAFFADYDSDVVPHARALLRKFFAEGEVERVAAKHVPSAAAFRRKFDVKVVRGTFRYDDAADAAAAVRELSEGLRDRLEGALADVADRIRGGKIVSERTFNALSNVLATARAFGEVMGDDVVAKAEALEGRIGAMRDAASVRRKGDSITDVVRNHRAFLDAAIGDVMEAVKDPAGVDRVMARFGAAPRLIED